jgi:hypothetical protein
MERISSQSNARTLKCTMLAGLLTLSIAEIMNFIEQGGLENPRATSLLKIIIFLFLFVMLYFHKDGEMETLMKTAQVLLKEVRALRKE